MDLMFFLLTPELSLIILMAPALPLHGYKILFVYFFPFLCHLPCFDPVLPEQSVGVLSNQTLQSLVQLVWDFTLKALHLQMSDQSK